MEALQGNVSRSGHIPWKAKVFGGFFTRTGGDLYVPYGLHTNYPGRFTTTTAVSIFEDHVTAEGQGDCCTGAQLKWKSNSVRVAAFPALLGIHSTQ